MTYGYPLIEKRFYRGVKALLKATAGITEEEAEDKIRKDADIHNYIKSASKQEHQIQELREENRKLKQRLSNLELKIEGDNNCCCCCCHRGGC